MVAASSLRRVRWLIRARVRARGPISLATLHSARKLYEFVVVVREGEREERADREQRLMRVDLSPPNLLLPPPPNNKRHFTRDPRNYLPPFFFSHARTFELALYGLPGRERRERGGKGG